MGEASAPTDFTTELLACMGPVRTFCRNLTRVQETGDDLAQLTLEKALRAKNSFTPGSNMRAWLFTIAKNQFISDRRRQKWQAEFDPELAERTLSDGIGETDAASSIDFDRMLVCLALLPAEQRDAIVAVGYLGLSYEDAAFRIQTMVGTIKSRVARGRVALAARMESHEPLPQRIDLAPLLERAERTPKSHPFYPIAAAFVDLYGNRDIGTQSTSPEASDEDMAWKRLVASGALDFEFDTQAPDF